MPKPDAAQVAPLGLLFELHVPSVETNGPLAPQVPKAVWQPVPQYALASPQLPYWEQQPPKGEPAQVRPFAPHVPSVLTGKDEPPQFP